MLLIKPLLALLSSLAFTAAYSAPGAYERMMVYYAYIMDCEANGGVAKSIAPQCAKKFGGGKPCNLNQLIRAIASVDPGDVTVTNRGYPQILPFQPTVEEIQKQNLAGVIDVGLANEDVGRGGKYSDFLSKTSNFVVQMLDGKSSQEVKNAARTSMNHVFSSRMSASVVAFIEKNPNLKITTAEVDIPGTTDKVTKINFKKSAIDSGLTKDKLIELWGKEIDGGHGANIQSLQDSILKASYNC